MLVFVAVVAVLVDVDGVEVVVGVLVAVVEVVVFGAL